MLGRVIAALAIVVGVSSGATAQGDRRDLVDKIHEQITKNRTGYKKQIQNKALAGCINWENSSPDNVKVRHFFYFYTSISSDREFLPSDLMRSAIHRCNELRKKQGSTCKCVPIDKNGKSALKVPDSFIEKARAWLAPPEPLKPVQTFRDCAECPEMLVIPAGNFSMGSISGEPTEAPTHQVKISRSFALGIFEVTFAEWDACARANGCSHRPSDEGWGRGDRPIINVRWRDAQEYVRWLSRKTGQEYRLPSEAEWEYAARAGTVTPYWWGSSIGTGNTNCGGCGSPWGNEQTARVGSFSPNGFGLHDMPGNVQEWVEDCWNDSYEGAPLDGSAWVSGDCIFRVLRGGAWDSGPNYVRSASRARSGATSDPIYYTFHGFRVAKTLP